MRISVFLLLVTALQAFAGDAYSQKTMLSLDFSDTKLEAVMDEIEQRSEFFFLYNEKLIDEKREVSLSVENQKIDKILDELFTGTDVTYTITDRKIILVPAYLSANKQDKGTISGVVSDNEGQALPGVTILIQGTLNGAITDADGHYSISDVPEDAVLIFSYVGMLTQEIAVAGQSTLDVVLQLDAIGIEAVVAIGYGTMRKSELTGSISQVKSEEITAYPTLDLEQALQGRASGIQIVKNNGEPGASYNVRIRGSSSINSSSTPLYVIDGFPGATLPPSEDIESIEILKDASATAIYGSRGANGVIMITTKRGKEGQATFELNSSYSVETEINRFDLLNKDQFVDYMDEIDPTALDGTIIGPGTDWQEEIFRTGSVQNHQLSVSGGNQGMKYYVSGTYYDNEGIIINSGFRRFSGTSKLDITPSEKLRIGVNLFAQRTDQNGVRTQETSGGTTATGVVAAAFQGEPTLPVYNDDGSYTISWLGDPNDNPVAIANERTNETMVDYFQGNVFGEYKFLPSLKLHITLGSNISNSRAGTYTPTTLNAGAQYGGEGTISSGKYSRMINENYLSYSKHMGAHNITAMAGYSYEFTRNESWSASGQSFLTDASLYWNLDGAAVYNRPYSGLSETLLSSFYGRINYKLFNRYIVTLNARYDGSSRFAKNHKWAFFPSGAVAWNIKDEQFMENLEQISQLKIRASYGVSGNQAISPYQSLARLGTVTSVQNSLLVNAVRPTSVANDNLTWESTAQTDIGIDLGLFSHRVLIVADYYYKKTTDLLFSMPLPEYSGYSSMLKNIGSLENKGFEITLTTVNIDGELHWSTDLNFSRNRNKVLELPEGNDIYDNAMPGHMVGINATNILREGEPVGSFYGFVYDGVYQEGETILPGNFDQYAGGEKYRDIDGRDDEGNLTGEPDGQIDGDDRMIIGNPHPDFIWGFNNTLSYKGFDLNIFILGSQGNDIYSFSLQELETMRGNCNSTTEALDRWTPSNTDTDVPVASYARGYHSSSRWIFDGSFVRLKNISLGYSLPANMVRSWGLDQIRFYVSAQNLFTITDYRGYDPEVNYRGAGSNTRLGFDYGSYPNAKTYTVGLKLTF